MEAIIITNITIKVLVSNLANVLSGKPLIKYRLITLLILLMTQKYILGQ